MEYLPQHKFEFSKLSGSWFGQIAIGEDTIEMEIDPTRYYSELRWEDVDAMYNFVSDNIKAFKLVIEKSKNYVERVY